VARYALDDARLLAQALLGNIVMFSAFPLKTDRFVVEKH